MKFSRNHYKKRTTCLVLAFLCVSASLRLISPISADAQVRPVNDYGALGLSQILKRLNTTASVMMIGAHPDDEDSALLAYLARGENARTAYLSLTRGDGGQNIIGPDLFESLGVIRTEELLQARRLDGAEQYFTRAFDYGFSKTLAEAKAKWPEDVIKCDTVRAIRLFRPLVVISRFSGTPADGHGQHQYSGYITPIAVKAAADPQACPDSGEPWQVKKFYVETSFNDNAQPTLKINTGTFDPILGRTYFEIAMEGRSQHRSQGEGRIEFHGDQFSGLNLVGGAQGLREKSIFEGLNTGPRVILEQPFFDNFDFANPQERLLTGLAFHYKEVRSKLKSDGTFSFPEVLEKTAAAIRKATGVQVDALADSETVVPGDEITVSVKVFQRKIDTVKLGEITLSAPTGWTVTKTDPPAQNNAAFNSREIAAANAVFKIKIDRSAVLTQPYWLVEPRDGDLFRWPKSSSLTLPFEPPPLIAHVKVKVGETEITLDQPVQYRFADPSRGEIRREINVVSALSVSVDRDLLVVPMSNKPQTRRIVVSVTNNTSREQTGNVALNIATDPQWKVEAPTGLGFSLKTIGTKASIPFDIAIPARTTAGMVHVRASANVGDTVANLTMNIIAYPHIQTHRYYTHSDVDIESLDLKTSLVNVGYIMGSGDEVPEAIRQMGLNVTMLEEKDLASGDLAKYDTIVVGIRASETRPDFVANNQRLIDYAKNGGNLILQYQRGTFAQQNFAPFPFSMADTQRTAAGSIARVVDENAKVTILQPDHPIFNFPNKISDDDFKGWVQERNAYNFTTFDPQYTPLLESHDASEMENKGGLVIARLGKGTWTYCSYSFFRQLPAGVGGAYRLFANMLSLSPGKKL